MNKWLVVVLLLAAIGGAGWMANVEHIFGPKTEAEAQAIANKAELDKQRGLIELAAFKTRTDADTQSALNNLAADNQVKAQLRVQHLTQDQQAFEQHEALKQFAINTAVVVQSLVALLFGVGGMIFLSAKGWESLARAVAVRQAARQSRSVVERIATLLRIAGQLQTTLYDAQRNGERSESQWQQVNERLTEINATIAQLQPRGKLTKIESGANDDSNLPKAA